MAETKTNTEAKTNKERLKEITDGIEQGIKELFQTDRYRQYLSVLSRFHRYSVNNTMLIYLQRPDATLVAGYQKWKNQFGRHVLQGERGITIIAPTPLKKKIEEVKLDPDTHAPMLDKDGQQIVEEREISIPMFKPVKVFDVSQTDGKPLPQLAATLTGSVEQYDVFLEALRRSAPVPVSFAAIPANTDGFFSLTDQSITIREGMSQVQTIAALVHEVAHSKLHNTDAPVQEGAEEFDEIEIFGIPGLFSNGRISDEEVPDGMFRYDLRGSDYDPGDPVSVEHRVVVNHAGTVLTLRPLPVPDGGSLPFTEDKGMNFVGGSSSIQAFQNAHRKDRHTEEVEAESISYAVCQYFGIQTGDNSFGYIASWSQGKELKELRASLETINKTASGLITDIEKHFAEICKERGIDPKAIPEQAVETASEPPKDPYQEYAETACAFLRGLYEAGELNGEFHYMTDPATVPDLTELLRSGSFQSARGMLIEAAEQTDAPQLEELSKKLEALSDRWDRRLSYRIEPNDLYPECSILLAVEPRPDGPKEHGVLFSGPTSVCEKLLTELRDGTMTARQARAVQEHWDRAENRPLGEPECLYLLDGTSYLYIQATDDGYDYSLYDAVSMKLIDGGQFSVEGARMHPAGTLMDGAFKEVCVLQGLEPTKVETVPLEKLDEILAANTIQPQPEQKPEFVALDTYPMPDTDVPANALEDAGYLAGDMLPLSTETAMELCEQDFSIYAIVDGGQAELCYDTDDIAERPVDAVFAIPREEWEDSLDFQAAVQSRMERQPEREAAFLACPEDCFAVYQLKHTEETRFLTFASYEELGKQGKVPERQNYDLIYTAPLSMLPGARDLESAFEKFNLDRPADFSGHSLSVSDILAVKRGGEVSYHYCDSIGFRDLPGFNQPNQPENYLKAAEMSMEDDANMIDGIINNGPKQPTVAELESQVKAGQSISLLDLAKAAQAEKRPRDRTTAPKAKEAGPKILDRLKRPVPKQAKKPAPHRSAEKELI